MFSSHACKLGWLSLNFNTTKTFISFRLLLFLIFLVVQILLFFIHHIIKNSVAAIKLSPDLYLLKPGEDYHKYRSRLLLQNSTGRRAEMLHGESSCLHLSL